MVQEKDKDAKARLSAVAIHDQLAEQFSRHYESAANHCDSAFLYGRKHVDSHWNQLLASVPRDASILDIGCGTGEYLKRLLDSDFLHVIGIEPSENMRSLAAARLPKETVRDGSVLDIPFEDNAFDLAYAVEVFRYFRAEDNARGMREIHRVLKPGGVFFGTFVNLLALDGFAVLVAARNLMEILLGKETACYTKFETPRSLFKTLDAAGFRDIRIHGAMAAPLRIAFKCSQAAGSRLARALDPFDAALSDNFILKYFAGHLIGICRK